MGTIQEQLRTWIDRNTQRLEALGPDALSGDNWCDVSSAEQEVFRLSPETVARVVSVFDAYLALADIAQNDLHRTLLCRAARKAYPWIAQGSTDSETFIRFAGLFGVSNRQAAAFFWKHEFWQVRQGLVVYADEDEDEEDWQLALSEDRDPAPDERADEPFTGIEPADLKTDRREGKGDQIDDDIPF